MELFAKIVDCIEPSIFAKYFTLGVSQGYQYASHKNEQNPGSLSFISQKSGLHSLQIFSTFKFKATSKTWTRTLDPDPEKHGINIGLKNMSDFRELCFIKTMRIMIYCLEVRVLTDI